MPILEIGPECILIRLTIDNIARRRNDILQYIASMNKLIDKSCNKRLKFDISKASTPAEWTKCHQVDISIPDRIEDLRGEEIPGFDPKQFIDSFRFPLLRDFESVASIRKHPIRALLVTVQTDKSRNKEAADN